MNIRYGKYNLSTLLCLPYKRILGFHEAHNGTPYLKSTFSKVWEAEGALLDETCKHKFRHKDDVNQYLFENWQFCEGNFVPSCSQSQFIKIFPNVDDVCSCI